MPRYSNRIFKKIKTSNLPHMRKKQARESVRSESQPTPLTSQHQPQRQSTTPESRSSSVARSISSSTSSQKLSTNLSLYNQDDSSNNDLDLVNIELMSSILQRSTKCKTCDGSVRLETTKRVGVAVTIELICENCDVLDELRNSEKVTHEIDGKSELQMHKGHEQLSINSKIKKRRR